MIAIILELADHVTAITPSPVKHWGAAIYDSMTACGICVVNTLRALWTTIMLTLYITARILKAISYDMPKLCYRGILSVTPQSVKQIPAYAHAAMGLHTNTTATNAKKQLTTARGNKLTNRPQSILQPGIINIPHNTYLQCSQWLHTPAKQVFEDWTNDLKTCFISSPYALLIAMKHMLIATYDLSYASTFGLIITAGNGAMAIAAQQFSKVKPAKNREAISTPRDNRNHLNMATH